MMLVSGASQEVAKYAGHPYLGILRTPRNGNAISRIVESGMIWACDNDCYQKLDRRRYLAMLQQVAAAERQRLQFVTVPDVVANAAATKVRWDLWLPVLRYYGLPAAYVAQDGQETVPVPWEAMAALFIGGSDRWKLGATVRSLVREAVQRGVWVHIGRVNSIRRMRYFATLGANSFDGTGVSRFSKSYLGWMLRHLEVWQHSLPNLDDTETCTETNFSVTAIDR